MDKYDTSQLTEFPRFESETSQSGVSTFFNKLWKFPLFSPVDTSENNEIESSSNAQQSAELSRDQNNTEYDNTKIETGSPAVEQFEGRSLPNVLRRIRSLTASGSGHGTRYADTELARYWMPDDISRECYECASRFSTLRRRHHCRVCGQIFCSRCCSQRVPGQIFGCAGGLRVCNYCCNVVLSYLKENDMTGEISPDMKTLQENLQVKFPEHSAGAGRSSRDNFVFARDQEDRGPPPPEPPPAAPLADLHRLLLAALPAQQHRYRLVRYNGVWRGSDIQQWIMDNTNYKTRFQSSQACQNLLSSGYMECVTELLQFADYALYRPTPLTSPAQNEVSSTQENNGRLVESVSSYCLDLNVSNSSARLIKAPKSESNEVTSAEEESTPTLEQSEVNTESKKICKAIAESGEEHLQLLMRQCLAQEGLSASWGDVLYPLCQRAADITMPDLYGSDIDVRNYVQVKKVPGGVARDTHLVHGVVLTKNVAHRGMPQSIENPTILLLDCSIAYERVEGKLTSLEPLLMQEQQYLVRAAARVAALRASVVACGGGVARAAQDALRAARVALAVRVRPAALRRLRRAARADLVPSLDARIAAPRLGAAAAFYHRHYETKTLMIFEGCAEPHLGCCILLRGACNQELVRVKRVAKFMVLACYNWKLEKAFLGDIGAVLPEPGSMFDDDTDEKKDDTASVEANATPVTEDNLEVDDKITTTNNYDSDETKKEIASDTKTPEPDDPLQKSKSYRKTDSEKIFSCGVPISDFSDPLHSTLSVDDEVFLPKEEANLKADDSLSDRWSGAELVLCMSPNVSPPAPALPPGVRAPPRPASAPPRPAPPALPLREVHPFISEPITSMADDPAMRAKLAHYRATGGRLVNDIHKPECPLYNPSVLKKGHKDPDPDGERPKEREPINPLSPSAHQRLRLLLYSYSSKSANVPDFCVNPWVVTIDMYGQNDISLGAFLEKYCFNSEYKCPSSNCQVPMNQHVRRFVHGDVCVTITCNTVQHSNVDKVKEDQNSQVMFWWRCGRCGGGGGRATRVSRAALGLSLAAYLRLCVWRARYGAGCRHPLPRATHAFTRRAVTAHWRFSEISTYDIQLPPDVISTKYDTLKMREALIQQLKDLMLKGHEMFANLTDSEAEKDHQNFKQHTDQILVALTSSNLNEQTSIAGVVRSLWAASDAIIAGEKLLRDAQERWTAPLRHAKHQDAAEEKSDIEDSLGESVNNDNSVVEEDEDKGDKKTVRQILSQLLSNNQPSNQGGIILSSGVVPVVVHGGDIGAVIAATLASVTYQRALQRHSTQTEPDEPENISSGKDKTDGDKSKAAKSNDHIEVLLKDGLVCRVYYATQFQRLRHMLLAPLAANPDIADVFVGTHPHPHTPPDEGRCCCDDKDRPDGKSLCSLEEGFIRSMALCEPWAARGGKSGSTFCKTKDDRYVLKEMTKPEWQQFLEFAPHYFNYVISSHQSKQPSLLARILGVYSVGGAGNGILAMENVWYRCGPEQRYDLKGSARHRLADRSRPLPVLLDEDLLLLRWDTQLYVTSGAWSLLRAAVERDCQFLEARGVMDYSLLLARRPPDLVLGLVGTCLWLVGPGADCQILEARGVMDYLLLLARRPPELVLGFMDYIRTFTWDKKLEHLVKKNLGSGQPTVVSPLEYRRRFSAALRKYFLHVPAHADLFRDLPQQ